MPAKRTTAAEKPAETENTEAKTPDERKGHILALIEKLPQSCSSDMDRNAVFGRVMSRLQDWGATDEEIAAHTKQIREATDKHVSARDARMREQAERVMRRRQAAVESALEE